MPATVECEHLLEDEGDHCPDVDHHNGLSVELRLLCILILGKTLIGCLRPSSGCPGLGNGCFGNSDRLGGRLLELRVGWHDNGRSSMATAKEKRRAASVGIDGKSDGFRWSGGNEGIVPLLIPYWKINSTHFH